MSPTAVLELPISSSTINSLITFDSALYNVSEPLMRGIVKRESNFNQYAVGDHGTSIGLVQIHLPAHKDISRAEAENPIFAINYLASELAKGHCSIWSTCAAAKANLSPPSTSETVANHY